MTFGEKVIKFNRDLTYAGAPLPPGIRAMNPFREHKDTMRIVEAFYSKYYYDNDKRHLILGINPGRFGAGLTGIPFTDPKRLVSVCGIPYEGKLTHEPSSVFIYEMITAYGGAQAFYHDFYINSMCPLGFTSVDAQGREKNYNYYDSRELVTAVHDYMVDNIKKQIRLGCHTDVCFCFGTGKNEAYLRKVNEEHGFFKKIAALEHPRFIMQYRSKLMAVYVQKYLDAFAQVKHKHG